MPWGPWVRVQVTVRVRVRVRVRVELRVRVRARVRPESLLDGRPCHMVPGSPRVTLTRPWP